MEENTNTIDIVFEKIQDPSLPNNLVSFLNKTHSFKYNDNTKIRDLFKWIMMNIWRDQNSLFDEYMQEHIRLNTNNRIIKLQLDSNLKRFLKKNNLKKLILSYIICPSGGNGGTFEELCTIRINPNETCHKNTPHVHVYKKYTGDNTKCIRIILKDLSQMKNDKIKKNDLFNKKEIEKINKILTDNKEYLTNYYNSIQNGEYPEPIIIPYNNKEIIFK